MRTASIFQTFEFAPKLAKFSFVILGEKKTLQFATMYSSLLRIIQDLLQMPIMQKKNLVFGNQESLQQPWKKVFS